MRRDIFVNGRFLSRRITGVERYGRGILSAIRSRVWVEETRLNGIAGHAWEQFVLPLKINSRSILWSPANTGPLMLRRQALTIHDLSPLDHPEWFQTTFAAWYRLFLPLLAKRVQIIFTPSEYMKKKIIECFDVDRVIVAPNGVDTAVFHPGARQTHHTIPGKYILFIGSIQPRKNLTGLLAAWYEIKDDFKDHWLVIAGESGRVFRAQTLPADERVLFLDYVSDDDLPGLYADAELFILPSLDEGFGLPALEAMACGTPVLVSNRGALPEVVGDAAVIFDPSKPCDLSFALRNALQDSVLRSALKDKGSARAKTFSWRQSAELVWNTLNEN